MSIERTYLGLIVKEVTERFLPIGCTETVVEVTDKGTRFRGCAGMQNGIPGLIIDGFAAGFTEPNCLGTFKFDAVDLPRLKMLLDAEWFSDGTLEVFGNAAATPPQPVMLKFTSKDGLTQATVPLRDATKVALFNAKSNRWTGSFTPTTEQLQRLVRFSLIEQKHHDSFLLKTDSTNLVAEFGVMGGYYGGSQLIVANNFQGMWQQKFAETSHWNSALVRKAIKFGDDISEIYIGETSLGFVLNTGAADVDYSVKVMVAHR